MSEKLAPSRPDQPNHDRVALSENENALFEQIAESYDNDNAAEATNEPGAVPDNGNEQYALFNTENPADARTEEAPSKKEQETTYEIGQEVTVRRNVYKDGNVDFSQTGPLESGWVVESVAPDGSYVVGKEGGLTHDGRPGHLRKVVDAKTLKNWSENQLEDEAYTENARHNSPNRMNPNQPSLDSMERISGPESVDYNTRIGSQADRISKWLGSKAEKYENAGGVKGMARKALRRLGSAAYRKSGLKATVEGVKSGVDKTKDFASRTAEAAGNAKDRTLDSMSDLAGRVEDAAYRPVDYLRQKRDEALKRAAVRARERAAQKARHEQIKREQAQTRREKEVLDYVASQETDGDENESSIDLTEEVKKRRGEARGKHRKANERTERRRKAMRALREQLGETSREMWDASRTKQLGGAVARSARKAKNVAKGAATGAIDGARAGARL
jgi:hypothetical protein